MTPFDALCSADPARHFQAPDPEHVLAAARSRAAVTSAGVHRSRSRAHLIPAGAVALALAASVVAVLPGGGTVQSAQARLQRAVAATIAVDSGRIVTDITGGGATVHHEQAFSGTRMVVTQDTRSPGFHLRDELRIIDGAIYRRRLPDGAWRQLEPPPQLAANREMPTTPDAPVVNASALRTLLESAADVRRVAGADGTETYAATVEQAALLALRDRPPLRERPAIAFEPERGSAPVQVRITVGGDGLLREVHAVAGDAVTTVRYVGLGEAQEIPVPPVPSEPAQPGSP